MGEKAAPTCSEIQAEIDQHIRQIESLQHQLVQALRQKNLAMRKAKPPKPWTAIGQAMRLLLERGHPMHYNEIAVVIGRDKKMLSTVLSRAVQEGWLERSSPATFNLTQHGCAVLTGQLP